MARPRRQGLRSFTLDVDFLTDEKLAALRVSFGAKGIAVLVALLCAIYRQGYYAPWNHATALKVAADLPGVSTDCVGKVIEILVKYDFFHKGLFCSDSVLTSAAIQRRYFAQCSRNKHTHPADLPYIISQEASGSAAEISQLPKAEAAQLPMAPPASGAESTVLSDSIAEPPSPATAPGVSPPGTQSPGSSAANGAPACRAPVLAASAASLQAEEPPAPMAVAQEVQILAADDVWLDHLQVMFSRPREQLLIHLRDFATSCVALGRDTHKSLADCKSNFVHWLNIRLYGTNSRSNTPGGNSRSKAALRRPDPKCGLIEGQ